MATKIIIWIGTLFSIFVAIERVSQGASWLNFNMVVMWIGINIAVLVRNPIIKWLVGGGCFVIAMIMWWMLRQSQ